MTYKVPKEVLEVLEKIEEAGFEAYLVGGCVRDLLMGRIPKDWDITTSAKPEQIQSAFENTFYENEFGTVGVVTGSEEPALKVVEVTPYRVEAKYSDKRHPDAVRFAEKLEDDLGRRDFTVNALAMKISHTIFVQSTGIKDTGEVDEGFVKIVDLFGGMADLESRVLRTVGDPADRFGDDALRILRVVRFVTDFDSSAQNGLAGSWKIEKKTEDAVQTQAHLLMMVSKERIRDEFNKIIMSASPGKGMRDLNRLGLLKYVAPEMSEGIKITQNKEHIYTVWEHSIRALDHAAKKGFSLEVRLAALFHDIGKPRTKAGEGVDSTFYNHETVGARMVATILTRLRYSNKMAEKIIKLVRWHLFFSDTEVITLSAVRRIITNVGVENIWDLMKVRFCDRVGMGRPKEEPYRLRKYEAMVEEALRSPLTVGMLKIDGKKLMDMTGLQPGPKIGFILHALLEEVLDDPALNTEEYMEKRAVEFSKMSDEELQKIGEAGKDRKTEEEEKEISQIRQKYHVE